ncbi:hypothetical protein DEU56DRAFT_750252 [Suillus clintonianus]|uniref:uncharacterized protein n=1 Tax=Suillus clintonianus TaxID=1904413 RepID=UPI001B87A486|nr:uncharacterized protein DEU56DRAFT_750252 [Suillus clintonianus]KAG2157052.1 hypothetical protein DEU56DRAFT_750252 [Suillus clintonianus]
MTLPVFMLPHQVPAQCCALQPACPQPGKNMPDDWQTAPPHLKSARKNVSSDKVDPGLSRGWSYFVEECGFKLFMKDAGTLPQEVWVDDLHRHLCLRTHLHKWKDAQIHAVIIKNIEINVSVAAEHYHRAWNALSTLAPSLARYTWTTELPKLEEGDIRGIGDSTFGESSGNRTLSWIWKVQGVATAGM